MSRRKQARPRSCKREDGDDASLEGQEEELDGTTAAKSLRLSAQDIAETGTTKTKNVADCAKENDEMHTETFRCETCSAAFDNLVQFMDHRNLECGISDLVSWKTDNTSRSETPSSLGSLENEKNVTQLDDLPVSPSSKNLDPEQVPFSNGVDDANPYSCQFCEKAFSRLSYLKIHEQVHEDLLPFKCSFCSRLFRHKRSRDRHVKLHTGDKKYKCAQCDSAFARSDHLKSHMKTHDVCKPFQCAICNRGFTHVAALTTHMSTHSNDQITEATAVTNTAGSTPVTDPSKEFRCSECKEVFSNENELHIHIAAHSFSALDEKSTQCSFCTAICIGQLALQLHVEHFHSNDNLNKCTQYTTLDELRHESIEEGHTETLKKSHPVEFPKNLLQNSVAGNLGSFEILVCPYCLRDDFDTLEILELHMQSVHSVKSTEVYTCNYCNAPYKNLYSLHEHMRAVHQNQPSMGIKYPCSRCSKEFPSIETLADHKKRQHHSGSSNKAVINSVYCVQCALTFPSPAALQEHISTAHKTLPKTESKSQKIRNLSDGSVSAKQKGLSPHKISTSLLHSALMPDSAFVSLSQIPTTSVKVIEAPADQLTCEQCNSVFPDLTNFTAHMKLHMDSPMGGQHLCNRCNKQFLSEEQLEAHLSSHFLSLVTEYGCTSCVKLFSKPDELQKHLMDIHAHHLYRCSLCKEIFDSKVNVQVHFAIKHSNECKIFKCIQCNMAFRSESEWQIHVRITHLQMSKPYRCLFCKESFPTEMDLQCHLATHNKPFKCSMCNESFLVEFLLDKHIQNIHSRPTSTTSTSNKPTDIQISSSVAIKIERDADFLKRPELLDQTGRVGNSIVWRSSDELYRCNICDMKFNQVSLLQSHKAHDHGLKGVFTSSNITPSVSPQNVVSSHDLSAESLIPRDAVLSFSSTPLNIPIPPLPSVTSSLSSSLTTISIPLNIPEPLSPYSDKMSMSFFSCTFCSQTFKNKADLDKHSKIHLNTGSQKCNICDEVFPSSGILAEHKLQHCKIQQGNTCVICKISLRNEDQFYIHSQEHGFQGAVMQCIICRQTLASLIELQMHGKHHFQNKPTFFTCCVCLKSFDSNENLVSKLNSSGRMYYVCKPCYHGETSEHICKQCNAKFGTSSHLEAHASTHKKTYQCIKCQESFNSEREIQMHVATHVMMEGNFHQCKLCSTIFDSPYRLQCHLIEHTYKDSEFTCSVCCKTFSNASEIQSHVLEHGLSARRYGCSHCNQIFFFSAELENHMFSHDVPNASPTPSSTLELKGPDSNTTFSSAVNLNKHYKIHEKKSESTIKCSLCSEIFSNVTSLQRHFISSHTASELDPPKKVYQCCDCKKEFPCLSNLQGHMRMHKSGAKFPCPMCKKIFALSRNLKIHMRSHSGEKPYECPICKKRFSRKENRKVHLKSHTGSKPFICPICNKSFSRKSHVREHTRTHYIQNGTTSSHGMHDFDMNSESISGTSEENSNSAECMGEEELSDLDDKEMPQEVTSTSSIPEEINGDKFISNVC
ncbi:hypothetical protein ACJMK2_010433 [Sinanodonta woodiana]|uniref:C2H2-type domain-containing protein n=2 Tax=Sinanodonta woodiana TaxID=1069815 RepID=A0ABD3VIC4_SINWO